MGLGLAQPHGRTCASPPCASMARTTALAPPKSHTARLRGGVVARCSSVRQPCACRVASAGKARIAARACGRGRVVVGVGVGREGLWQGRQGRRWVGGAVEWVNK